MAGESENGGVVLTWEWAYKLGAALGVLLIGTWRLIVNGQLKRITSLEQWREDHEEYTAAHMVEFAEIKSDVAHLKASLTDVGGRIDANAKVAREDRAEILAEIRAVRAKVS